VENYAAYTTEINNSVVHVIINIKICAPLK